MMALHMAGGGQFRFGLWLTPGRLLPILAPLLATIVLWGSYFALSESRRWELHTYEVLRAVGAASQGVDEVVLRQQNFVLTGDPVVLDTFQRSLQRLVPAMQAIARLTADNPRQQAAVAAARPLMDAALGALTAGVAEMQPPEFSRQQQRLRVASIDTHVARLHAAFDALAQEEHRLLVTRGAASDRAHLLMAIGGLLTAVAFLASAYVAIFSRRRSDRRRDAPAEDGRLAVRKEMR
jgi:CHASE3 domain sensor protein